MQPRSLADPCGRFLPVLLYHDVNDRLQGRRARADARWGRLARPAATGRLIWVVAGATRHSVRLGVELARAIVARRLDAAVTLTYESEFPDLLAPLARSVRIGWGYGPADYVGSMNTVWRRLLPFAIVLAGIRPRRNLLRACVSVRHALAVAPPGPIIGPFERIYPSHHAPCPATASARATDLDTLLTPTEVEQPLARLIAGAPARDLWWWHGRDAAQAKRLFALFRGYLPQAQLVVTGPACADLALEPAGIVCLSAWNRTPIDPDTLVLADADAWIPALAAGTVGAHFAIEHADALWQALASGAAVSAAGRVDIASPDAASAVALAEDENDVIHAWAALAADPVARSIAAEASRRAFWSERRAAEDAVTELLERVLAWR